MTRRRVRLTAAAAILVAVITVALSRSRVAMAVEVRQRSCSLLGAPKQPAGSEGWLFMTYGYAVGGDDRCPVSLGFQNVRFAALGETAMWKFQERVLPLPLSRLRMRVYGDPAGTGIEYVIRRCDLSRCEIDLPIRVPAGNVATNLELTMQPTATWVGILATCTLGQCNYGQRLRFGDFEFTYVDDRPPIIYGLPAPYIETKRFSYWVKPSQLNTSFLAEDSGFGMGSLVATLDNDLSGQGPPLIWEAKGCDHTSVFATTTYLVPLPCPNRSDFLPTFGHEAEWRAIPDGEHSLTLRAFDALGNGPAVTTGYFKVDGTPPETPQDPVVTGLVDGRWTVEDRVQLSWTNGQEVGETTTASGIARSWYQLDNRLDDAGPLDPVQRSPGGLRRDRMDVDLPTDGLWDVTFWLEDRAGNVTGVGNLSGKQKLTIGRDRDPPPAPQLSDAGWLSRDALVAGATQSIFQPPGLNSESPVCGYAVAINAAADSDPPPTITHPGATTSIAIPSSTADGERFMHVRAVSCAGVASPTASTGLRIDSVEPRVEIEGLPQAGSWTRGPVTARVSATDDRSGVAAIDYALNSSTGSVEPADDFSLAFHQGRNRLDVTARDRAGNQSAPSPRFVNVDSTAPAANFRQFDPNTPTRVRAAVTDELSGVADAQIRYRRVDVPDTSWHGLPTAAVPDNDGQGSVGLQAEIPDEQLAAGSYALSVVATDNAGNSSSSSSTEGGDGQVVVDLPLRAKPSVEARIALRLPRCFTGSGAVCGKRSRCANAVRRGRRVPRGCKVKLVTDVGGAQSKRVTDYAKPVAIIGVVRNSSGQPLADESLKVFSTPQFGAPVLIRTLTTDRDGGFSADLDRGPTRQLTVTLAGTTHRLSARATATLLVRAGVTLRASHGKVRAGGEVRFSGRVLVAGASLPETGKLVQIQKLGPQGIWTGVDVVNADESGRFRAAFLVPADARNGQRLRFRALVAREADWPFEPGLSADTAVTVR